jgi:hypothetical protein
LSSANFLLVVQLVIAQSAFCLEEVKRDVVCYVANFVFQWNRWCQEAYLCFTNPSYFSSSRPKPIARFFSTSG